MNTHLVIAVLNKPRRPQGIQKQAKDTFWKKHQNASSLVSWQFIFSTFVTNYQMRGRKTIHHLVDTPWWCSFQCRLNYPPRSFTKHWTLGAFSARKTLSLVLCSHKRTELTLYTIHCGINSSHLSVIASLCLPCLKTAIRLMERTYAGERKLIGHSVATFFQSGRTQ